jgi:hypothetical protein
MSTMEVGEDTKLYNTVKEGKAEVLFPQNVFYIYNLKSFIFFLNNYLKKNITVQVFFCSFVLEIQLSRGEAGAALAPKK